MSDDQREPSPELDAFARHPDLTALARQAAGVQRNLDQILAERERAWWNLLAAVREAAQAKALTEEQLLDMLLAMRDSYGTGHSKVWDRHMPPTLSSRHVRTIVASQRHYAEKVERNQPNGPTEGNWVGTLPECWQGPMPLDGDPVIYMLFDADGEPVYLGSTGGFRTRLAAHVREKPGIHSWSAQLCESREQAYDIEDQLLKLRMHKYNRKQGR